MTASVMITSRSLPAPNKYNKIFNTWKNSVGPRVVGTYTQNSEKVGFTDEAVANGLLNPASKA